MIGAGSVYYHEYEGTSPTWRVKISDQYLDEGGQDVMLRSIFPDFEAQSGDVTLTVHCRKYPQGTVTSASYTLAEGADKKDFRITGRLVGLEFSGTGFARIGKPVIDAVATGRRH